MAIASVGTLGTAVGSTSASTLAFSTATNALAAGDFAILTVVTDNLGLGTGASNDHTKVAGGTGKWCKLYEHTYSPTGAAGDAVCVSVWLFLSTGTNAIATPITITFSGATTDKAASAWKFTKGAGTSIRVAKAATASMVANILAASNGFGSVALSGMASASRLYFRGLGKEANIGTSGFTASTSFTAITMIRSRNNASAVGCCGEFRINTSTGETSNPTLAVSGDSCGIFLALEEYTPSGSAALHTQFDASTSTCFTDVAGTTAVTADGDLVACIKDTNTGLILGTQATSGSRPIYRTNAGKPYLENDGSRFFAASSLIHFGDDAAKSMMGAAVRYTNGTTPGTQAAFVLAQSGYILGALRVDANAASTYYYDDSGFADFDSGPAFSDGVDFALTATNDGANQETYVNGVGNGTTPNGQSRAGGCFLTVMNGPFTNMPVGRLYGFRIYQGEDSTTHAAMVTALSALLPPSAIIITASNLTTGSPVIGSGAAIQQDHVAAATPVTTGSPSIGAPAVTQLHVLAASNLTTGSPVLGTPTATLLMTVSASALTTGSPVIGGPAVTQTHALTGSALTTGSPVLGAPALTQLHALAASALTTGSPVIASPALTQLQVLAGSNVTTSSPVLGAPAVTQTHALTGSSVATGSPVIGGPAITQLQVLTASTLATASPALGAPAVTQVHSFVANSLATGSPVLGSPALTQLHSVAASSLTTAAPAIDAPTLTQTHALGTSILSTGPPSIGSPTVTQTHALVASALTPASPVLGSPAVTQVQQIVASDLAIGSPALAAPPLTQLHLLAPLGLDIGSPVLDTPAVLQTHVVAATGLATGSPDLGTPVLIPPGQLVPSSLATGSPVIAGPALTQTHQLAAAALETGPPQIDAPALAIRYNAAAIGLVVGSPQIDAPGIVQVHALAPLDLSTAAPVLDSPPLGQRVAVAALDLATGSPDIGAPTASIRTTRPPVLPNPDRESASFPQVRSSVGAAQPRSSQSDAQLRGSFSPVQKRGSESAAQVRSSASMPQRRS